MAAVSIAGQFDRASSARLADWLLVATAVSLPWSTSATSILAVLWLLALLPSLRWSEMRRDLTEIEELAADMRHNRRGAHVQPANQ